MTTKSAKPTAKEKMAVVEIDYTFALLLSPADASRLIDVMTRAVRVDQSHDVDFAKITRGYVIRGAVMANLVMVGPSQIHERPADEI